MASIARARVATGRAAATLSLVSRAAASLTLACALAPLAAAQQERDTVALKDGKSETGKVQSEDYSGLTLELRGGATRTFTWDKVAGVDYASEPELGPALEAFAAGQLEDALAQFGELAGSKRPPVAQQVQLHLALIHERLGQADEALAAWRELLATFPKGRYLSRAAQGVVWNLLSRKQPAEAEAEIAKIAAGTEGLAGFAGEGELLRGRVRESQNDAAGAQKSYQAAESAPDAPAAVKQEARLGQARSLALEGKKSEAEAIFKQLTKEDAPSAVLAGAWNGIAALWADDGKAKRDKERLYDALYGYLRGVVQYSPRAREPSAELERSLAGAARCFRFLSQLEQTPEKKRRYEDLASEHLAQLRRDFPSSPYLEGF